MEKTINENGAIRLVPTIDENGLYNGSVFGKVVDCPQNNEKYGSEVTDEFKKEEERKQQEELNNTI